MAMYTYAPTVLPHDDFDAWTDAQVLREAMKGLGTDEDAIIDLLTHRTCSQRLEIVDIYKTQYGRDVIEDLKDELKGDFEKVILALMSPFDVYLAKQLQQAMSGAGTEESTLIEILYPLPPEHMDKIKSAFKNITDNDLESAIDNETSGHFKKLLVSLSTGNRDTSEDIDDDLAAEDAQIWQDAGEGKWGTDESAFLSILATRSFAQLRKTFDKYQELTSNTIEHAIESETSGDTQMGFLAIVKCARNMPAYFAQRLYDAMKVREILKLFTHTDTKNCFLGGVRKFRDKISLFNQI
ncbi:Annexin A6 [Chamberlinius hualienensis]